MKTKEGFVLRTVMGKHIIVAEGAQHADFNKIITLNDSAALLWEKVEGKDFTVDDMARILTDHYEVEAPQALADAKEIARKWKENGLLDD